jgi:hypothetical protein
VFDPQPPYRERGPQPMMIPLIIGLVAVLGLGLGVGAWWLIARSESTTSTQHPVGRPSTPVDESPTDEGDAENSPTPEPSDQGPAGDLAGQATASAEATSPDGVDSESNPVSYSVDILTDGSLETAWRMRGDGSGSSITFRFDQPVTITELALTNGYTKQDAGNGADRYQQERRITQVTWTMDDGSTLEQPLTDPEWDLQRLPVDEGTTSTLTLTIDGTTEPGDPDRDYTAISEVEISGRTG